MDQFQSHLTRFFRIHPIASDITARTLVGRHPYDLRDVEAF